MANRNKKRRTKSRSKTRLGLESLEEKRLLTTCVDMEDLTLGQTYMVGDSFVADNTGFQANVRARQFTFANGNTTAGGFAQVENNNLAGHLGQDMQVNNILLDMTFNQPVNDGLTMNFGEYGGNLNLGLNGTFTNFDNFADLDGMNIGGSQITVVNGFGNDRGTISFDGAINNLAIGGQELWIDHLCLNESQQGRLDWGDAPDGPNGPFYNTLAVNNGAFHVIDDNVFLGDKVDPEGDGQPNLAASGDDNNGATPDDEDGVVFLTPIVPGQDARVEVTANDDGFLSAWMDFDRNGQWDPGDQIFATEFLTPGTHILSFPVPDSAEPGTTYSRWRYTNTELNIGPAGTGNTFNEPLPGEVEDYRNNIQHTDNPECIDFEDLALGSTFFVGDSFIADNTGLQARFTGEDFTFSSGATTSAGQASIQNGGLAGDAGQDVGVNNILLDVDFGGSIPGLAMDFGEFGGNLNIEINGQFVNFDNFIDLDGAIIGGTIVTVPSGGFGNDQGELLVSGTINSFKVGGQELWIDHICVREGQGGELDWGDAPDSQSGPMYNTLMVNNGAVHLIDNVHFLGDRVDAEADGQPSVGADRDDAVSSDDEDGVRLLTPMIPGQATRVEVDANADGFLSAWVDFDRNGQWDPGDQIYSVQFIPAGNNLLSFNVPAAAEPGETYLRWRFTSQQLVIGPAGPGSTAGLIDGEVEDYLDRIQGEQTDRPDFDQDGDCDCDDIDALVDNIANGVYDAAMDLTGDGVLDIDDVDVWLAEAAAKNGLPGPYLYGDANLDGVVDISDFNIWNANKFTNGAGWCGGDWNADGATDVSDFNIWNTNKFQSSDSAAPMSTPSPNDTPSDVGLVFAMESDSPNTEPGELSVNRVRRSLTRDLENDRREEQSTQSVDELFALIGGDSLDAWS